MDAAAHQPRSLAARRPVERGTATSPWLRDLIVAALITGSALWIMLSSREAASRPADVVGAGLLLLAGAVLLARHRAPATVLVAVTVTVLGYLALDYPGGAELPLLMAALYTAMAAGRTATTLTVLATVVVASVGYRLAVDRDDPLLVVITVSLLVLVVLLGDGVRTRRLLRAEIAERLRVLERDKEHETERRLMAERVRIARELHDVLAHTITAITVQAGAAADGLAPGCETRSELRSLRSTAQEAMGQLSATIGLLRSDGDPPERHANPRLARLPELARTTEDAGHCVGLAIDAGPSELPPAVELTVYRVVQESLTNVIRHAPGAAVEVTVSSADGRLVVSVEDDGGVEQPRSDVEGGAREGFGIIGMRERAQTLGGSLTAGPDGRGGFQVRLELPLQQVSA